MAAAPACPLPPVDSCRKPGPPGPPAAWRLARWPRGMDIALGLVCARGVSGLTRTGAMLGVAVGATFTFFANRSFAFKDHDPKLAAPALKFLRDLRFDAGPRSVRGADVRLPARSVVLAKMIADVGGLL